MTSLYIPELIRTEYMCQEKKEEEDTPALKIVSYFVIQSKKEINYKLHRQHKDQQNNNS